MRLFIKTLLILLCTTSIGACNPFKVTDPNDPRFDPGKFRFSDYKTKDELKEVFRVLFPIGTSKETVDAMLVTSGGAEIRKIEEALDIEPKYILVPYREPVNYLRTIKKPFFHNFIFGTDHKILNIQAFGGHVVFKDSPSWKEFNELKLQNKKGDK